MTSLFSILTKFCRPGGLMMGLAASLGGCASSHAPHPAKMPHTQAEAAYIPANFLFTASDGLRIPFRLYQPQTHQAQENISSPRAVILALHGFGDSRDAWEFLAPTLTRRNILIAAPDIRGFGEAGRKLSDGATQSGAGQSEIGQSGMKQARTGWPDNNRLRDDVLEELVFLHQHYPSVPLYLMGESMGGAIATLANATLPPDQHMLLQGTILLSPAVMRLYQPWRGLLAGWNMLSPHHILTGRDVPGKPRLASRNIPALRRMFFNPLTRHETDVSALHGLVELMAQADYDAPYMRNPVLVIFGDHDEFVPPRAYAGLMRNMPYATRFDELDGAYHLLSREKYRVGEDILSWIAAPERLLPSGGDFAAQAWHAAQ